jgi:hypothetical protein
MSVTLAGLLSAAVKAISSALASSPMTTTDCSTTGSQASTSLSLEASFPLNTSVPCEQRWHFQNGINQLTSHMATTAAHDAASLSLNTLIIVYSKRLERVRVAQCFF